MFVKIGWTAVLGIFIASQPGLALAAIQKSRGYYRIPYADGTKVRINGDVDDHSPVGRIDMKGREGSTYKVVAAAAGRIRMIEDRYSERIESGTCYNNYVWIEHPNGEWSKYSHLAKNSVKGKAGLRVGQWVKMGTYLGDESDVGCAAGAHLHFEVAVPRETNPINPVGGFVRDNANSKRNRDPRICGISGGFQSGSRYTAAWVPSNYQPGHPEVARHGLPIKHYQCQFSQMSDAGYEPTWIDMFDSGGRTYVNIVGAPVRPGRGNAFHGLTGSQYQNRFTTLKNGGYKPVVVDSYLQNGRVLYAGFFKKRSGPDFAGYHGASYSTHDQKRREWLNQGYHPKNISVISVNGRRVYTGIYEKAGLGAYRIKSQIPVSRYQSEYDANTSAGRRLAYLNGYRHNGRAFLVAIFSSRIPGGGKYRHGMTGDQYQREYESARRAGLKTRLVTGYHDGNPRYAAGWR